MKIKTLFTALSAVAAIFFWSACTDQKVSYNPAYRLAFSADTISFDTVFTTIGSATAGFMVYNRNSKPLSISSVTVANGDRSGFRINVDGTAPTNNTVRDVEIRAHDSLYVFVSVTVNPTLQDNPLLISDSIVFVTNENVQTIQLQAYGQDVIIFRNKTIHNDTILAANKPYLIYNDLTVDSGKTVTLNAGARLYFHQNGYLKIKGNFIADGTQEQPIQMRGDRLDYLFPDVPYSYLSGQWGGVQLLGQWSMLYLNQVTITGGRTGLDIPNKSFVNQPVITINNSLIQNFDSCGISATNAKITLYNSEISNCKSYCLLLFGGNYDLTHNTIANYYDDVYAGKRRDGSPSVLLCNYVKTGNQTTNYPLMASFVNCAIAGSMSTELAFDTLTTVPAQSTFYYCYLMRNQINSPDMQNIVWGKLEDNLFVKTDMTNGYYNFQPDSLSVLRGMANPTVSNTPPYNIDRKGTNRMWDNKPDTGAYQWAPAR